MRSKRLIGTAVVAAAVTLLALSVSSNTKSVTADNGQNNRLQAVPFTFVGLASGCNPFPSGSRIVTAAWLPGFGLPDDGTTANTFAPRDAHIGLLLSKDGPTADCSAAGAHITGLARNATVTELGFDFRNGTHCGAGAPRFNVVTSDNVDHFFGCQGGTQTPAPQDLVEWTRVRLTPAQGFPPITAGQTVKSIDIIYDEGTDTPTTQDPKGVGLVNLDNIDINGTLITSGPPSAGGNESQNGDDSGKGHHGDNGNSGHGNNDNGGD